MDEVRISDITMRQGRKPSELSLTFKEKLELAKLLDKLGASVIEIEGIAQPKVDALRVKSIAAAVKDSVVAVPVQLSPESVEQTWNALREARHPRLQVVAPVSPVQMEYLFHQKPEAMLQAIGDTLRACRALTADVEFVADDATRADAEFLYRAVETAIAAGAAVITVCDTAGTMLPNEFTAFLDTLCEHVPAIESVCLGVAVSDHLSMADACAIAAIRHGAREVKAAAYRLDGVSLPNMTRLLAEKGDACGVWCSVHTTQLRRIVSQIERMCQTGRSKNSPFDTGVRDAAAEATLTCHDGMEDVLKVVETLGYDLSEEDGVRVWDAFCRIAQRKEQVTARELDAIVAAAAMQVPPAYQVESYVVNTGNTIAATAHMRLRRGEQTLQSVSMGDGPVDASFLAIEQIVGHHYELDDFQIQAITVGREAMGQTVVKLRSNGKLYSGRGISTDVVGSSILAYINALNKIVYEEETA